MSTLKPFTANSDDPFTVRSMTAIGLCANSHRGKIPTMPSCTTENVVEVLTNPAYLLTAVRTVGVAVGVTALCVVLAVPLAAYMALVAGPRARPVLVALVGLWAGLGLRGLGRLVWNRGG